MNRKNFFKWLFASIASIPLSERVSGTKCLYESKKPSVTVDIALTKNILLPFQDEKGNKIWDTNYYDQYCKLIGIAQTMQPPFKQLKFESELFPIENMTTEMWNTFYTNCSKYANENFLTECEDSNKFTSHKVTISHT